MMISVDHMVHNHVRFFIPRKSDDENLKPVILCVDERNEQLHSGRHILRPIYLGARHQGVAGKLLCVLVLEQLADRFVGPNAHHFKVTACFGKLLNNIFETMSLAIQFRAVEPGLTVEHRTFPARVTKGTAFIIPMLWHLRRVAADKFGSLPPAVIRESHQLVDRSDALSLCPQRAASRTTDLRCFR
jgi:hypothetical protein